MLARLKLHPRAIRMERNEMNETSDKGKTKLICLFIRIILSSSADFQEFLCNDI